VKASVGGIGIISIAELVIGERIKGADQSTFSGKWNGVAVAIKVNFFFFFFFFFSSAELKKKTK
jgi:hypothetical protein